MYLLMQDRHGCGHVSLFCLHQLSVAQQLILLHLCSLNDVIKKCGYTVSKGVKYTVCHKHSV